MWEQDKKRHLGCTQLPFAFRVCRKSCGYCSASAHKAATVSYDFKTATDQGLCDTPRKFFASEPVLPAGKLNELLRSTDFDPLENVDVKAQSPTDYFVVTDHDYTEFLE